jgi:hypothetical protein
MSTYKSVSKQNVPDLSSHYKKMTVAQLKNAQKKFVIADTSIKGSGKNGAVLKEDRVKALVNHQLIEPVHNKTQPMPQKSTDRGKVGLGIKNQPRPLERVSGSKAKKTMKKNEVKKLSKKQNEGKEMEHLWKQNTGMVEDSTDMNRYDSWSNFILSEVWNTNYFYNCIPVYWVWIDSQSDEYIDFEFDSDELTLVYLSLAPCNARTIKINVKKSEERKIMDWLIKYHFKTFS